MNLVQGIEKMMGGSAVGLSYGTSAIASNFAGDAAMKCVVAVGGSPISWKRSKVIFAVT